MAVGNDRNRLGGLVAKIVSLAAFSGLLHALSGCGGGGRGAQPLAILDSPSGAQASRRPLG